MSVLFPRWMNAVPTVLAVLSVGGLCTVVGGTWYYATPKFFRVGYMPTQPGGGFSHQVHAGKLGIDCRYCHTNVEDASEANVPSVSTCYGCHADTRLRKLTEMPDHRTKTEFIRTAYMQDEAIAWRRVHKVPDYVRNFPHQVHVRAGVSCYSCHGQITGMPIVNQVQPMSMGWCLDCHRNPDGNLVPGSIAGVTELIKVEDYFETTPAAAREEAGRRIIEQLHLNPPENCGACHY